MKKFIACYCLAVSALLFSEPQEVLGERLQPHHLFDKEIRRYIHPSTILIGEEGIVIDLGDEPFLVSAVFHDEKGFYFIERQDSGAYWVCPVCGKKNRPHEPFCRHHGWYFRADSD